MPKGVLYHALKDMAKDEYLKPYNNVLICKYTTYLNKLLGIDKLNMKGGK